MNPGDLCICGHTREIHFGAECSIVAGQHTVLGGRFRARQDCPCKQFVELGLAVELFQALEAVLPYLPDQNDAKDYAATNDGRAGSIHVASIRARELIHRAKNS